jgi:hypothetical protein
MNFNAKFGLNASVTDTITGIQGQVVGVYFETGNRVSYMVAASTDGGLKESWISEDRLELT